ncbi:hypothetical protein Mgra_00009551 [Meloidogyne graminicola]|uniref:Uncharacterized protein n=1 Tax=Meloidogyne graminicola TaxID=189291 RepID=A0A8S9Z945_9BILA|nr:hypothetical protein Mgra_00009551 [Meloidogyne graminicola]
MIAVGGSGFFKGKIEKFCSSALKLEKNIVEIPNGSEVEISSQLVRAIMELEQCPHFNCGFGSNLTIEGTVECESAFICSDNFAFGGIAAVIHFLNNS